MQNRSCNWHQIRPQHVLHSSGAAAGHAHCASLPSYAACGGARCPTSWFPGQKLYGMAVAFPARCSRRVMESLQCKRKDCVDYDRRLQLLPFRASLCST